jgi:hypothetical protein
VFLLYHTSCVKSTVRVVSFWLKNQLKRDGPNG